MVDVKLENTLRSVIRRYGFEQVNQSLQEIGRSERKLEDVKRHGVSHEDHRVSNSAKRHVKVTATGYVSKLELPSEKKSAVIDLADRFQNKVFLPTFGDIANFCRIYGIDEPASKSRASAIPRVFKFIATMDTDEIQRILAEGMFSGPSRLEPIADAIRNNGRSSAGYVRSTPNFLR